MPDHLFDRSGAQLQGFDDGGERHDVRLITHRDRLAVNDGQRQRQGYDETRPDTGFGANLDAAAKLIDSIAPLLAAYPTVAKCSR